VRILVDAADTYLLMTVDQSEAPAELVISGAGGSPGEHGSGGSGGAGGAGGNSYSWTETYTTTDSRGNRQTRTRTRRNSGGRSGSPGRSGSSPRHGLAAGARGAEGSFTIELFDGEELLGTFPFRYDLQLEGFTWRELQSPTRDGVLEFGETIEVLRPRLRNIGAMPTPANHRVRLTLAEQPWLTPHDDEIFLERALAPGEVVELDGILRFDIVRPPDLEPGDPFIIQEIIAPQAEQLGPELPGEPASATPFRRRYANVSLAETFEARFPLENRDGIRVLRSLAPGERSKILFTVHNISQRALGGRSEGGRRVRLQLEHISGDVSREHLLFTDAEGIAHDLDEGERSDVGYFIDVESVDAEDTFTLAGVLGFASATKVYVGAELSVTIWLESLALDGIFEPIQERRVSLRAEPGYAPAEDTKVILVTHNEVTRASYEAWNKLIEQGIELRADEWSLARYGHFDHSTPTPAGPTLGETLSDRLVVVLNRPFNPSSTDERALPTSLIQGADFRASVTARRTRYLVFGSAEFQMAQWLEPAGMIPGGGRDFPDVRAFRRALAEESDSHYESTAGIDFTANFDTIAIEARRWPWGTPRGDLLQRRAIALQEELCRLYPHRRYLVIHHGTTPEYLGRSYGLLARWSCGHLEVRRSLNLETSAAVFVPADDASMDDPAFVTSDVVHYALLLALPFAAKVERLAALIARSATLSAEQRSTGRWLVIVLFVDLSEEQSALRRAQGRADESMLERRLSYLTYLRGFPFSAPKGDDPAKHELLVELCAGLEVLARSQRSRFSWFGKQAKISRYFTECVHELERYLFTDYGGSDEVLRSMRERIDARRDEALTKLGEEVGFFARLFRSAAYQARALYTMQRPADVSEQVQREIDVWREPAERVWPSSALDRAQLTEHHRQRTQKALAAAYSIDRETMLVDGCEPSRMP